MPNYVFKCLACHHVDTISMEIKDFLEKRDGISCPTCKNVAMKQQIGKINSKIERKKGEILPILQEEARKIVKKIESGDEREITKIYGDKV